MHCFLRQVADNLLGTRMTQLCVRLLETSQPSPCSKHVADARAFGVEQSASRASLQRTSFFIYIIHTRRRADFTRYARAGSTVQLQQLRKELNTTERKRIRRKVTDRRIVTTLVDPASVEFPTRFECIEKKPNQNETEKETEPKTRRRTGK